MQMIITVAAPDGAASPDARAVGTDIARRLSESPRATNVASAWTAPAGAAANLVSKDGKTGLIVADITAARTTP